MPKIAILNDQSVIVCDTKNRDGMAIVVLKAVDATPVFWSPDRSQLDGNVDVGGTPGGGIQILNTDAPLVLLGIREILWARAPVKTFLVVEVMECGFTTTVQQSFLPSGRSRYVPPQGRLPIDDGASNAGWWRKGNV
jgi:hypothetical protein